eukprot:974159-Pyramimonas_sp.AAC.1
MRISQPPRGRREEEVGGRRELGGRTGRPECSIQNEYRTKGGLGTKKGNFERERCCCWGAVLASPKTARA